jgi:hypothetical protein
MRREPPVLLRLSLALLERANPWSDLLAREGALPPSLAAVFASRYEFKNDEKRFARELLRAKQNLWLFRCDQRAFCADFAVVDMSSPDPRRRRALVIDLKQGSPLRAGGGGAGVQFRNASRAVAALAREGGVLAEDSGYELLSGDRGEVLAFLRARGRGAPASR